MTFVMIKHFILLLLLVCNNALQGTAIVYPSNEIYNFVSHFGLLKLWPTIKVMNQ